MRKNILIICDKDEVYCRRLDAELKSRLMMQTEIYCFTRTDLMMEFAEKEKPLVLVIGEGMLGGVTGSYESMLILEDDLDPDDEAEKVDCSETDEDNENASGEASPAVSDHIRRVSKYRSAEVLISNILELCAEIPDERIGVRTAVGTHDTRKTVFYAPVHGKGQTSLCMAMALNLAERGRRVLVLNLEPCSGWSVPARIPCTPNPPVQQDDEDTEEAEDRWEGLSELVYHASGSEAKFRIHLERLVRKFSSVDYIPPVRIPGKLRSIGRKQWQGLLRQIDSCGIYDDLLIDLTDAAEGLENFIVDAADIIYTVTGEDPVSERRQREYEKGLLLWGGKDILYRTKKVRVPDELRGSEQKLMEFAGTLIDE